MRTNEFLEKSEEERNKELEDYRFVYYKPDTLPNLFGRKEDSPIESQKSPIATEL